VIDSCCNGHSTLGLFRADFSSAGSTLALDLQPFRLKLNLICIVTGMFTNNSVISRGMEMCSHRILESSMRNDRLCFDNSAALLSRCRSVTGDGNAIRPPDCTNSNVKDTDFESQCIRPFQSMRCCSGNLTNHKVNSPHTRESWVLLTQSRISPARSQPDNAIHGYENLSKRPCDSQSTRHRRYGIAFLSFTWRSRRTYSTNEIESSKMKTSLHFHDTGKRFTWMTLLEPFQEYPFRQCALIWGTDPTNHVNAVNLLRST
jgi:hypothetical protein